MKIPDGIDFDEYLEIIGEQESQEIHWAPHWTDQVIDRIQHGHQVSGDKLPWAKTHNHVRLRPAELSIWAGINGHRKSMVTGMVMAWLAQTSKVCIASLEMQPEATLQRMLFQVAGCAPSQEFARSWLQWADDRIAIYDELDSVEQSRILGMCYYVAKELGCKHVVIDSLAKCGINGDDYNAQKQFVDRLAKCAKSTGIHVHLVCHMRKGKSEQDKPGKFDVKGAGEIIDLADNLFVCWKDKQREDVAHKKAMGVQLTEKELEILKERCDQKLSVAKQRHGEWEGDFRLWFHSESLQFTPDDNNNPIPYEAI